MNEIESAEAELMRGADPLAVSVRRMSVPGTNRTTSNVRSSVADGRKADMTRMAHFGSE